MAVRTAAVKYCLWEVEFEIARDKSDLVCDLISLSSTSLLVSDRRFVLKRIDHGFV